MSNNALNHNTNKSLHFKECHKDLIAVTNEYISINGFRLNYKRELALDPKAVRLGYKEITIKDSFFKHNTSLLKGLKELSSSERSDLLRTIIEGIFNINLTGMMVVIER